MPVKAHRCQRYGDPNVLPAQFPGDFAKRSLTTNSRRCSNQCSRIGSGISDQSCCNFRPGNNDHRHLADAAHRCFCTIVMDCASLITFTKSDLSTARCQGIAD